MVVGKSLAWVVSLMGYEVIKPEFWRFANISPLPCSTWLR
jgi:hypothetical protein